MSTRKGQSSRKRPVHLPAIAPKDEVTPLSRHGSSPTAVRAKIIQPRLRFPPRSRTGCCRKIKCDEVHPQCNQCARLGHVCDYQPRLCFRDDTRRVMERMPDVKTKGNVVWDPAKNSPRRERINTSGSIPYDLLPDFSRLTSDEDREKKAQGSAPGTYHVIVVPESFARLPEYTDDALEIVSSNPYSSPLSEYSSYDPMDDVTTSEDPNVVFLSQFGDPRKQVYPCRRSYTQSPESDLGSISAPTTMMYTPLQDISEDQISESVDLETYGMALLDHFQNTVWMQLIPGGHGYLEANIFEQEASNFPPLLHVMMAVSALSLVHQGNAHYMDALKYYDHALPSLQSSLENCDDVLSDGLFLTHFLLLIYQIALTTSSNGPNLWLHHMSRLLQLSLLRHSVADRERYPLIIWLICHVDLYALFSGAGSGEYIRAAIESHLLPGAESLLYPAGVEDNRVKYPGECITQPLATGLYRECFLLAARLGLLAAEVRASKVPYMETMHRELESLRGGLRQLWNSQEVRFLMETSRNQSSRSQHIFHQISVLFHTSLLFSCLIFRLGQGNTHWIELEREIQHHTEAILQLAAQIVGHGRQSGPLFLTFPLFLSGAVTTSNEAKMVALELLAKLREADLGYQASTTRSILQVVYEAQLHHSQSGEFMREIDWTEVAANHGYRLVSYG
ncbi:fungal-specific transcription factor domain-containing protein [Aspergillus recurvatus]